jgi:hypothetical protein
MRACYQNALLHKPELHGRVTTDFVIRRDGSVLVHGVTDEAGDTKMARCMAHAFEQLRFSRPVGGWVHVRYPIVLNPE